MSRRLRKPVPRAGRCVLLCMLWACGALPGPGHAAEPPAAPALSRAVEVPPPAGWTPDTPLFQQGVALPARPARPAVPVVPAVQRPAVKVAKMATATATAAVKAAPTPASRVRVPERLAKTAAAPGAKASAKSLTTSAAKPAAKQTATHTAKHTAKPAAKDASKLTLQTVRGQTSTVGKQAQAQAQAQGQALRPMARRTPMQPKVSAVAPAKVGASKGKAGRAPTAAVAATPKVAPKTIRRSSPKRPSERAAPRSRQTSPKVASKRSPQAFLKSARQDRQVLKQQRGAQRSN